MIELEIFSQPGADKENEDYVWHAEIVPGMSLIIVCDGMGGLSHGAEAANFIILPDFQTGTQMAA